MPKCYAIFVNNCYPKPQLWHTQRNVWCTTVMLITFLLKADAITDAIRWNVKISVPMIFLVQNILYIWLEFEPEVQICDMKSIALNLYHNSSMTMFFIVWCYRLIIQDDYWNSPNVVLMTLQMCQFVWQSR